MPAAAIVILTPTSGGSVTDSAGSVWSLSSRGYAEENGKAVPGGADTSELTSVGGIIWALGAQNGEWYVYRSGYWIAQGTLSPVPVLPPVQKTPPYPALNVSAQATGPTSVVLAWDAPTTGTPPFGYMVFIRPTGTSEWLSAGSTDITTLTVTGLSPGVTYDFEVVSYNN